MSRILTVLALALATALTAPAAALALVQVDRGIAGARLGNTRAEVRAALGTPARVITGSNDFGPFITFRYRGGITISFQGEQAVSGVSTTGRGDRTASGVGVGSSEKAVKRGVKGVKCLTEFGVRHCHTSEFLIGRRVTDFTIKKGKVNRVTVARVLD